MSKKHLKAIFKTDNIKDIKSFINQHLATIDTNKFKNFDRLNINQQKAFRYALFLEDSNDDFKKAKQLVELDRIKTITNGTQKDL